MNRVTLALRFPSRFELLGLHRVAPDGDCVVPVVHPAALRTLLEVDVQPDSSCCKDLQLCPVFNETHIVLLDQIRL